jgi:CxxC motif-containing protein
MENKLICLSCPIGCHLTVRETSGELEIEGNRCPKGLDYAREEYYSPSRVVTATCHTTSQRIHRAPVRSDVRVPLDQIDGLLAAIYALNLHPPLRSGETVISDFNDTGVNVVLSTDLD